MSDSERMRILQIIIDRLEPEEIIERLEWDSAELVDSIALDILASERFDDLLEDEKEKRYEKDTEDYN